MGMTFAECNHNYNVYCSIYNFNYFSRTTESVQFNSVFSKITTSTEMNSYNYAAVYLTALLHADYTLIVNMSYAIMYHPGL